MLKLSIITFLLLGKKEVKTVYSQSYQSISTSTTVTPAAVVGSNLKTVSCQNENDIRPALTSWTETLEQNVTTLRQGQKAAFYIGETHNVISNIFFETAAIAQAYQKFGNRVMVAMETPHDFEKPNQHPAATYNATKIHRYAPYSRAYLYDYLHQNNIATCFCDMARDTKNKKINLNDNKNKQLIKNNHNRWLDAYPNYEQDINIMLEDPLGMYIRNAFMLQNAFATAQKNDHDILIFLVGASHLFGTSDNIAPYHKEHSLSHLQKHDDITGETVSPQPHHSFFLANDGNTDFELLELATQFNDHALEIDGLNTTRARHQNGWGDEIDLNEFYILTSSVYMSKVSRHPEDEQRVWTEVYEKSGGFSTLNLPTPQSFEAYKKSAYQAIGLNY